MVSFDPLCGIAARKETMKLAGLRLRVIWTLPVFYYLDLHKIEIKNCAQAQEACDARLFYLPKYFYYVGDIAWQYLRNIDKSTLQSGAHG